MPLSLLQRVELWDRSLERVRATLRAAGMREVSTPAMRGLLGAGSGPIFQVRRSGDAGPREQETHHLVEWYRPDPDVDGVLRDVEALVRSCFEAAGRPSPAQWRRDRHLGPSLRAQPSVGVHVVDYPAAPSAMAVGMHFAHRFETFVEGVSCANGYLLDDPTTPSYAGATLDLERTLMVACGAGDPSEVALHLDASPSTVGRGRTWTRLEPLVERGLLEASALPRLAEVEARLAVAITPTMQTLLARADDPIALQLVPDVRELHIAPEERPDPIGDQPHTIAPGLIQRYADRVLLKPTLLCAVYCRFCFRRDVVGDPDHATLGADAMAHALATIRARPEIWEVILTGGDPLVLAPARLGALIASLMEIPHVRVIRIHTRVPTMAPERITPALVRALRGPKPVYVVLHANHVSELTPAGLAACSALIDAGIPMLSQSVLLKGVNDSEEALDALLRELVANRIKPYYLHHPDLVEGTSHLRVSLEEGRRLVRGLRGRVSGLCQPVYVLDIPGGYGKVPAGAAWVDGPEADGTWRVTDPAGAEHRYREP